MRYAIVIEKAPGNYCGYAPDVPGCVAVGDTPEEVKAEMKSALAFHFEGMQEDGDAAPPATARVAYVEVEFASPLHPANR